MQDSRYVHRLTFDSPSVVVYYTERTFPDASTDLIPASTAHTSVEVTLDQGDNLFTIVSTHAGSTTVNTGAGADHVAVRSISGPTNVNTGIGNDLVYVGSEAGEWAAGFVNEHGDGNGIAAFLDIDGGTGFDQVDVDDTADNLNDDGTLTSELLSGIFASGGSMGYDELERLDIHLGDALVGNVFTIESTHDTLYNDGGSMRNASTYVDSGNGSDHFNVESISGPTFIETRDGADIVRVGSDTGLADDVISAGPPVVYGDPLPHSTLNEIDNAYLDLDGGTDDDTLMVFDSGDTNANVGEISATQITGLGMTLGINYDSFRHLMVALCTRRRHVLHRLDAGRAAT